MKSLKTLAALAGALTVDLACWELSLGLQLATRRGRGMRTFVTRPTQMSNTRELLRALAA